MCNANSDGYLQYHKARDVSPQRLELTVIQNIHSLHSFVEFHLKAPMA